VVKIVVGTAVVALLWFLFVAQIGGAWSLTGWWSAREGDTHGRREIRFSDKRREK